MRVTTKNSRCLGWLILLAASILCGKAHATGIGLGISETRRRLDSSSAPTPLTSLPTAPPTSIRTEDLALWLRADDSDGCVEELQRADFAVISSKPTLSPTLSTLPPDHEFDFRGCTGSSWVLPGPVTHFFASATNFVLTAEWTIETWVKPFSLASSRYWLSWATTSNKNCILLQGSIFEAAYVMHHVIVTWNGEEMNVYIDGLETTSGIFRSFCGSYTGSLVFGQEQDSVGGGFQESQSLGMEQSAVAIYNKAWAPSEIPTSKTFVNISDPSLYALWTTASGIDETGNGNTATINSYGIVSVADRFDESIVATAVSGANCSGEGIVFDGVNDYVELTPWEFGGEGMSVETYLKYNSINSWSRIFDFSNGEANENVILANLAGTGEGAFHIYNDDEIGVVESNTSSFFDVGVWVHVVVTVEGNDMKLYKNGVLTASETDGVEPQLTTRSQHWIGRSAWVDNGYFDGTIAFIRFWHGAALDNSTIQQLYKAFAQLPTSSPTPSPTSITSTISSWRDRSGNGGVITLVQPDEAQQPLCTPPVKALNGHRAVRFGSDGGVSTLVSNASSVLDDRGAIFSDASGMTIFVVLANVNVNTQGYIFDEGRYPWQGMGLHFDSKDTSDMLFYTSTAYGGAETSILGSATHIMEDVRAYGVTVRVEFGGNQSVQLSGTELASSDVSELEILDQSTIAWAAEGDGSTRGPFTLGGPSMGQSLAEFFSGDIAELLIFRKAMSSDEIVDVEMVLGQYYALYEWERAPTSKPTPTPTRTHEPTQMRFGCVSSVKGWVSESALNALIFQYNNDACPGIVRSLEKAASRHHIEESSVFYDVNNHSVTYGDPTGGTYEEDKHIADIGRHIESVVWCHSDSFAGDRVTMTLSSINGDIGDTVSFAALSATCSAESTWSAERYNQIVGFFGFQFGNNNGSGASGVVERSLFASPQPTIAPTNLPTPTPTIFRSPDHEFDFRSCDTPFVADTGAAGDTIEIISVKGANCSQQGVTFDGFDDEVNIKPWRFGGEAMTAEAYFMTLTSDDYRRVFEFSDGHKSQNGVILRVNAKKCSAMLTENHPVFSTSNYSSLGADNVVSRGLWLHAVFTVDLNANLETLYINGVSRDSSAYTSGEGGVLVNRTREMHGIGHGKNFGYFNGTIAYLRFWHGVALDTSQIAQLYEERIQPSQMPTPSPTQSYAPSPKPSPETEFPTPIPSATPTALPSTVPTSSPTPFPTVVPTVGCTAGQSFDGVLCLPCTIGRFQPHEEGAPWPQSCRKCPTGKFNTQLGAAECFLCSPGKLSSPDRSYCEDCKAGEYNFNNTECKKCSIGKYAPVPLSGGCIACAEGSQTNNVTGATECSKCDSGFYGGNATGWECLRCPKGTSSPSGQASCRKCEVGTISNHNGASTCDKCAAGKVSPVVGGTECFSCPKGTYQNLVGMGECFACAEGTFANDIGAFVCTPCATNYDSLPGASSCNIAEQFYFLDPAEQFKARPCPESATCEGKLQMPRPNKNFWVDRSAVEYASKIYPCHRLACTGAAAQTNGTNCWAVEAYNSSSKLFSLENCESDSLLCLRGSGGPLCGSCMDGFTFNSAISICVECTDSTNTTPIIVMSILGFIFVGVAVLHFRGIKLRCSAMPNIPWLSILMHIDTGTLKILWSTMQIVSGIQWNLNVQFPPPVSGFLSFLSFFQLDFLTLDCVSGRSSFETKVYVTQFLPLMAVIFVTVIGLFRYFIAKLYNPIQSTATIVNQHTYIALLISYLVLPTVASLQFKALDCLEMAHDGSSFLRVDSVRISRLLIFCLLFCKTPHVTFLSIAVLLYAWIKSIDCHSNQYIRFRSVVAFTIVVYQLVPLIWFLMLWRVRYDLNPPGQSVESALLLREKALHLLSLQFLFGDYRPSMWCSEVYIMYIRIFFIGILPLLGEGITRAFIGIFGSTVSFIVARETMPFIRSATNFLLCVANLQICIMFFASAILLSDTLREFGLSKIQLGVVLLAANLVMFFMVLWWGNELRKMELEHRSLLMKRVPKIEFAKQFSATKFATTLEWLVAESLATSQVLCFYYTSSNQAHTYLRGGIPASRTYGGVVFTLNAPHELTSEDLDHFSMRTVVLVCALPRRLLEAFSRSNLSPNSEVMQGVTYDAQTSPLRRLPSKFLSCLRPQSFSEVLDPAVWVEGVLLLPPNSVKRAYRISDDAKTLSEPREIEYEFDKNIGCSKVEETNEKENDHMESTTALATRKLAARACEHGAAHRWKSVQRALLQSRIMAKTMKTTEARLAAGHTVNNLFIARPRDITGCLAAMNISRSAIDSQGLVPVFHYTTPLIAPLILTEGLKMSTQGQGDGGVYFSTLSPFSYGLGSAEYEGNLIVDCFGKERLNEYRGKHKLDLVIIYGIEPGLLLPAPGGRVNATMVAKKTFEELTLPDADGCFHLRPDSIFGAIVVNPLTMIGVTEGAMWSLDEQLSATRNIEMERKLDLRYRRDIAQAQNKNGANDEAIAALSTHIASPSPFPRPLSEAVGIGQSSTNNSNGSTAANHASTLPFDAMGEGSEDGSSVSFHRLPKQIGKRVVRFGRSLSAGRRWGKGDDVETVEDLEYPESMLDSELSRASDRETHIENPFLARLSDRNLSFGNGEFTMESASAKEDFIFRPSMKSAASTQVQQLKLRQSQQRQQREGQSGAATEAESTMI